MIKFILSLTVFIFAFSSVTMELWKCSESALLNGLLCILSWFAFIGFAFLSAFFYHKRKEESKYMVMEYIKVNKGR